MYSASNSLIAHKISGSFHWQLKLNHFGFAGETIAPSYRTAFMDTGSTLVLMPKRDWIALYNLICANLPQGSVCYSTDYYFVLKGYKANKDKFGPITVTIDDTQYQIPFERFFMAYTADTLVLNINTKDTMIVLGLQFLNSFYQVFDLKRNQMALVPNIYSTMPAPVVTNRTK